MEAKRGKRRGKNRKGNAPPVIAQMHKSRPDDRRCAFVNRATGKQCGNWNMRGATRCHFHGGYRQNPKHPATLRRYRAGDITETAAQRAARREVRGYPRTDRDMVLGLIRVHRLWGDYGSTGWLEGLKALHTRDNGKAWRRWRSQLEKRSKATDRQDRKAFSQEQAREEQAEAVPDYSMRSTD